MSWEVIEALPGNEMGPLFFPLPRSGAFVLGVGDRGATLGLLCQLDGLLDLD